MKIIPFLLIGVLIIPESMVYVPIFPLGVANAHPIHAPSKNEMLAIRDPRPILLNIPLHHDHDHHDHDHHDPTVVGGRNPQRNPLECDACMFLANGFNETVLHNPKVISIITTDMEQICKVVPSNVQQICITAAEQTAPLLLNHLGNFVATEGCTDLGICHTVVRLS